MIWKVLVLLSLCLIAASLVCNIASTSTNISFRHYQRATVSIDYQADGDPVDPPDRWPS